jgi:putative ABC transport system permease protein
LLLASDERQRFIVYLIETGTPDWLIVASLTFDALILGLAGSLIGLLVGDLISLLAYHSVPGYIAAAFAIGGQRVIDTATVLTALAGGILAAFAAAALPAMIALRGGAAADPEAASRALKFARRLRFSNAAIFACGAFLICVSIITSALKPSTTVTALVGLATGMVICLPVILRYLLVAAHKLSRHSSDPSARLAIAELRGFFTRSVALFATGAIAAFLMILIGGSVANVQHGVRKGAADLLSSADIWIKPGGPENVYTTQPFRYAQTQRRLEHLSVVNSALPWRDAFLDLPGRRVWVLGVPPQSAAQIAPSQFVEGSLSAADKRLREGGWIALSQTIAQEHHLHIGQRFALPTPTGYASLRLAAIVANYGWLSGAIVMNSEDRARLWDNRTATQLAVTLKPGTSLEQGKLAIETALPSNSALTVQTTNERRAEVSSVLGSTLSRLNNTTIIVLVATIASVIALTIAAISQKRGRLESLMSIGMSFGQFVRLIFYETGTLLIAGSIIGIAAGVTGQALIDGALRQATGAAVEFAPAWQLGLRIVAVMAGVSGAASLIVALQAARPQPRAAFSTE